MSTFYPVIKTGRVQWRYLNAIITYNTHRHWFTVTMFITTRAVLTGKTILCKQNTLGFLSIQSACHWVATQPPGYPLDQAQEIFT